MSMSCGTLSRYWRYSANDSHSHEIPSWSTVPGMSSTPSMKSINRWWSSTRTGANPTPQLPEITVVTPLVADGVNSDCQVAWPSKWVCTSTNPGVTVRPFASYVITPVTASVPTYEISSLLTATFPMYGSMPEPSMMVPFCNDEVMSRGSHLARLSLCTDHACPPSWWRARAEMSCEQNTLSKRWLSQRPSTSAVRERLPQCSDHDETAQHQAGPTRPEYGIKDTSTRFGQRGAFAGTAIAQVDLRRLTPLSPSDLT